MRAGIDTSQYAFRPEGREPLTVLFVGSFRHEPNRVAMDWFVRQVLPLILGRQPEARLVVAGSEPPPVHTYADYSANLEMLGYVEDVREPLSRYSVFVCPILSGSGVRVKLLEAFAAGIPAVSTVVGAEGLATEDGEFCALAFDATGFAERVLTLLEDPEEASAMARRAREEVVLNWDMAAITRKLAAGYSQMVREKRAISSGPS
jgi:glycosyltransferase involved in cell wall biosynthesis